VSLSSTLSKNEKVRDHIRIKAHKLIAVRFWVKSSVNPLCGWTQVLVSKVFLTRVSGKRVPLNMNGGTRRCTRGWGCFRWRGSVPMWL